MLVANRSNLIKYMKELLGSNYSEERKEKLLYACMKKSVEDFHDGMSHSSFAIAGWLELINKVLGTFGVEYLDLSGYDVYYCNAGDVYNITIFWYRGKLRIGDIGSLVEKSRI